MKFTTSEQNKNLSSLSDNKYKNHDPQKKTESFPPIELNITIPKTSKKKPFELDIKTPLKNLFTYESNFDFEEKMLTRLCEQVFLPESEHYDGKAPSLIHLIFQKALLEKLLRNHVNSHDTPLNVMITALLMRKRRFLIRYCTLYWITRYIQKNPAIEQKLKDIFQFLKSKKVYFEFENSHFKESENIPLPSLNNTIQYIVRSLTIAESNLRSLLRTVIESFRTPCS